MSDNEYFAITGPYPPGHIPDNAQMVGPMDLIMQNLPDTLARADALADLELHRISADQIATMQELSRGLQVSTFCDSISSLTRRLDTYEQQRTERIIAEAKARADAEKKAIEDALSRLPDPDLPQSWADPQHTGELHTRPPTAATTGDNSATTDPVLEPKLDLDDAETEFPPVITKQTSPAPGLM
jgi:hypothetical protein